jgi:two-component system, sensor histidine kinase LadS
MLSSCKKKNDYADSSRYYLLEDTSLKLSASQAWQLFLNGKFQPQNTHSFNPGFTTSHYWLVVKKDSITNEQLKLEVGTAQINEIEFYEIEDNAPVQKYLTGDHQVYSSRPEPSLNFIFPLRDKVTCNLLKIDKRNESLQLTFVTKPDHFFTYEAIESSMVIGVLTGIIVLMLIFGLYLTVITKEKVYLFYILYVAAGWLYVLANLGYGYKYLWPDNPWFSARARPICTLLAVGFSLSFIEYYTGKAAYRWLRRLSYWYPVSIWK